MIEEDIELNEHDSEELYEHYSFTVDNGQEVLRVDKYLMDRVPNTSRNKIQIAAKNGNILVNHKLSEYHTGYRAFSREVLMNINYNGNSDDFIFDNQMICQIFNKNFEIAEITCPTTYSKESSSINFKRSIVYGCGVLKVSVQYFLHKNNIRSFQIFN